MLVFAQEGASGPDSTFADTDIYKNDEEYTIDTIISQYSFVTNDDSAKNYGTADDYPYMANLDSSLKAIGKLPVDTVNLDGTSSAVKPVTKRKMPASDISVSPGLRLLLWTAAIGFLIFIIYKLFSGGNIFKRQYLNLPSKPLEDDSPADAADFDKLISQSKTNKNYRLAIRYLYLKTLHVLAASNLIAISSEKTNYQYIKEMSRHAGYKNFTALTSNYEYVWYGKFDVDQSLFERIENDFKKYFQSI